MKFRATYLQQSCGGEPSNPETVIIIDIHQFHPEYSPHAVFVRENGTMGNDSIYRFTITREYPSNRYWGNRGDLK